VPDVAGPFDGTGGQWLQAQWYRDAYARSESGVYGLPVASYGSGDLALSFNGLTWSVGLGRAHNRGTGYERTTSPSTGTIPANTTGNPRIDRLVLRRDLAAKTCSIVRIQGTASASAVPPAFTTVEDGAWDLPLFAFVVPINSGTSITVVTDERRWIGDGYTPAAKVLTPAGGWYQFGGQLQALTVSHKSGMITISGVLGNNVSYNAKAKAATLDIPAFRPPNGIVTDVLSHNGVVFGRVDVEPGGDINFYPPGTIGANTYHSVNLSYPLF
jgi:hypothetical protein